jgi:hypothetical protein
MSDLFTAPAGSSPFRRLAKYAFFGVVALVLLALLAAGFENWRGRRAWQKFRAEWEAKGEQFDIKAFIPKPVPPEQNFAMTPLLAPLLDYHSTIPGRWRDPAGRDKANAVSGALGNAPGRKAPPPGNWQTATFIDLDKWQDFFVGHTNYPSATNSGNAARDVLAALRKFETELDELTVASARPHSVFAVHYEEHMDALLPHLAALKGMSQLVRLRSLARLQAGHRAEAVQDIRLCLRLAESVREEAFLISQLVRIAIVQTAVQPVWESCARHEWTEEQLAALQAALANVRLLDDYGRTIRGERAFSIAVIDSMRAGKVPYSEVLGNDDVLRVRLLPSGWFYQNQLTISRLHQERTIPLVNAAQNRVFVQQVRGAEDVPELKKFNPYTIFASLLYPAVAKTATRFASGQTTVDLATVACALERHRLAHGQYPEQLDPLVPRFMAKIPTDVINGELLKFRREPDGTFVLYSVGWNETDDGGEPGLTKSGTGPDPNQGDWVWRYPK